MTSGLQLLAASLQAESDSSSRHLLGIMAFQTYVCSRTRQNVVHVTWARSRAASVHASQLIEETWGTMHAGWQQCTSWVAYACMLEVQKTAATCTEHSL